MVKFRALCPRGQTEWAQRRVSCLPGRLDGRASSRKVDDVG